MADGYSFRNENLQPGMALGAYVLGVTLIADNQVVNPLLNSMLRISSNDTTAANRTFVLTSGSVQGQVLTLHFITGSSMTCQLADSGNCALSAVWEPLVNDTLVLQWDALSAVWRELCRADN